MATAAELVDWKAARDAVLQAIATSADVVEYEIRGRRVRRQANGELLAFLQTQVERCENAIARATNSGRGRARNYYSPTK
jgi:membrane-bound ClpP family serine protease